MERIELDGTESAVIIDDQPVAVTKRHPFRGLFWGLLLGIGLTGVLIVTTTISVSILAVVIVVVACVIVGFVWGLAAPPKRPKGPPPTTRVIVEQSVPTRFDDDAYGAPADDGPATPDDGPTTPGEPPRLADRAD